LLSQVRRRRVRVAGRGAIAPGAFARGLAKLLLDPLVFRCTQAATDWCDNSSRARDHDGSEGILHESAGQIVDDVELAIERVGERRR
jgi:hypothetical protein